MPQSKLNRKKVNFHLTGKGHEFNNPYPTDVFEFAFYCLETSPENQTPHFHAGIKFTDPHTMGSVLENFTKSNPAAGQIHITSPPNFGTVIGYHYGLGAKDPCPRENIRWIKNPLGWTPDNWLIAQRKHRAIKDHTAINRELLDTSIATLADKGIIHAHSIAQIKHAQEIYHAE